MNSEKKNAVKKEQKSPAPLPMYRPVVLRHVPTMVRRRYDHHLQSITLSTQGILIPSSFTLLKDLQQTHLP